MKTISKNKLLDYIEHEQIAFKFGDGLLCFTHPEGNYEDQSMDDDFKEMKNFIIKSSSIIAVNKEDVICKKDKFGFNEFANWTTDSDLLILVNKDLLLCMPNLDTHNVILELQKHD